MLPNPTKEQVLAALTRFDTELRTTTEWAGWESRPQFRYALANDGKRYPIKTILSLATGAPTASFSGGVTGANRVVQNLAFEVVPLREVAPSDATQFEALRGAIAQILGGFATATRDKFGGAHPMAQLFRQAGDVIRSAAVVKATGSKVVASPGQGNWASVPWISVLDPRETTTTQKGVYVVYLFRGDMTGVYLTLNQGVTELKAPGIAKATRLAELAMRADRVRTLVPELANTDFSSGNDISLRSSTQLGRDYEPSTIAHKFYDAAELPDAAEMAADLNALLDVYDKYLQRKKDSPAEPSPDVKFDWQKALAALAKSISAQGFVFEPWQLAAYVAAIRTKPFVILAGVSGTGKSRLPSLVAAATGGACQRVSVRPDWTDSSDVLGYVDLKGKFRPGAVLQQAREAGEDPGTHRVCLVDEMNLARVEQYFAEMLSAMEARIAAPTGGYESAPLVIQELDDSDAEWAAVGWPANLAIVGTVNMDETTHGFSRKVLDRAFTLEMSEVDLANWQGTAPAEEESAAWPVEAWHPRAQRLSELKDLTGTDRLVLERVIRELTAVNVVLAQAQIQVGYRVRDEVALFALHALPLRDHFKDRAGVAVEPLDIAFHMKLLPRLAGGSATVKRVLLQLLGWAVNNLPSASDEDQEKLVETWIAKKRPAAYPDARFPRTAARLALMRERLKLEGFTSYWL